ncbi:MAG TPA: glycosyltransferase family 87 protein [Terracidiphilus sp.]|nr:glycosyltransferase family 87 protein [Terracidiphilus sp.]
MTNRTRIDRVSDRTAALVILIFGLSSLLWGIHSRIAGLPDFRAVYYAARCAVSGENPYNEAVFLARYKVENGEFPTTPRDLQNFLQGIPICVNPPTTLLFVLPFTWLGWASASAIWIFLQFASMSLGAFFVWKMAGEFSPRLSLFLIAFLMANCQSLYRMGNISACVIGLSIFAFWSFRKKYLEAAGVLALAIGLALKPQVAGVLWFLCMLVDKHYRKRALQAFSVAFLLCVLSVGWISRISPEWLRDWRGNIAQTSARGGINDPGPQSTGNHGVNRIISLQTLLSNFDDNPEFYNSISMGLSALLLATWCYYFHKAPDPSERLWLGMASLVPLALLPVYHRQYDAKLLLLIIPACALLWEKTHRYRAVALVLTVCLLTASADIPGAIIAIFAEKLQSMTAFTGSRFFLALIENPVPVCILFFAAFYLWLLRERSSAKGCAS